MINKSLKILLFLFFVLSVISSYAQNSNEANLTVSINNEGKTNPVIKDPALIGEPSWGVSDGSNLWLHAVEFSPVFGQQWYWNYPGYLYKSTGSGQSFCKSLHQLQRGAFIDGIDVVYYDNDASANIHVFLQRMYGDTHLM